MKTGKVAWVFNFGAILWTLPAFPTV